MHTIYRTIACAALLGLCGIGITSFGEESNGILASSTPAELPALSGTPVLVDHAWTGTVVMAPNFDPGGIPPGIGIPHTLINGVPVGDYYAVVFFDGLGGCPSNNYQINAFRANAYWGYDERGPGSPFAKAYSSAGGGCMQEFHIDPEKGDDWLWGALSNTGTSSAIADTNNIPAFAICATASACDPIIPREQTVSNPPPVADTPAVSNVLFLPGIKGSKLYEDNPLCVLPLDSCGIQLWLPLADATVPELFLDTLGKSKRNVFVRDGETLNGAFGQNFYERFTSTMDQAQANGSFGSGWRWKAVAYDWRLSLPDIVHGGMVRGSRIYFGELGGTPYLESSLRKLASTSPTGKVTIVAHSNGGLVAKALMQELGDTLAAQLIDAVVFVGVPQSGAPRALGALMYGDSEGIPGLRNIPDFIMSAAHARTFGLNSPMAYHLLPSGKYMAAKVPSLPLVAFEDAPLLAKERGAYGPTINTEEELQSFARADEGGRTMPDESDLQHPNVLNAGLLAYAKEEHAALDEWQPPLGIEVYELGGFDVNTISGIDLYAAAQKDGSSSLAYRPLFTQDGDGTVPITSSLMMNASEHVHHLWLDLPGMRLGTQSYSHGNLFEAPEVELSIEDILRGSSAFPASVHELDSIPQSAFHQLAFYAHSPVSLTVTNAQGERAGVSESDTEESIPESTAGTFGEVKYVLVPADDTYTLTLEGERDGEFTLDVQELQNNELTASSTIAEVPVTSNTVATLTVHDSLEGASSLQVDEDGDGTTDFSVTPRLGDTVFPPETTTSPPTNDAVRSSFTHLRKLIGSIPVVTAPFPSPAPSAPLAPLAPAPLPERARKAEVAGTSTIQSIARIASRTPPLMQETHERLLMRFIHFLLNELRLLLRFVSRGGVQRVE